MFSSGSVEKAKPSHLPPHPTKFAVKLLSIKYNGSDVGNLIQKDKSC